MFESIKAIKANDPAAKSYIEIALCYPGLHALCFHRLAHLLYRCRIPFFPRFLNYIARMVTGIDIHPGATIAKGIMIDHGMGVVIGETASIAEGCLIYQGVTLGGTGKESGKRHPTLERNVVVGAGAKVLGNINIGSNVRVGAGSVVLRDVPENCTVTGIPGRVVKAPEGSDDGAEGMLDHNRMPDPVARMFSLLLQRIDDLQEEVRRGRPSVSDSGEMEKHFDFSMKGKKQESETSKEDKEFIRHFIDESFRDGDGI